MVTVDGFPVPVSVTGPEKGPYVVLLGAAQHAPAAYDGVCQRLHTASVRTVVIGADPRLHPKAVIGILDALDVRWGILVGTARAPNSRGNWRPPGWTGSPASS